MHENDFFNEDLLCALAGVAGEDNVLMSEPMREHTTFKIGGPADVFVTPDTEQGLVATLDTCYRCDLPLTIVGNGSDPRVLTEPRRRRPPPCGWKARSRAR